MAKSSKPLSSEEIFATKRVCARLKEIRLANGYRSSIKLAEETSDSAKYGERFKISSSIIDQIESYPNKEDEKAASPNFSPRSMHILIDFFEYKGFIRKGELSVPFTRTVTRGRVAKAATPAKKRKTVDPLRAEIEELRRQLAQALEHIRRSDVPSTNCTADPVTKEEIGNLREVIEVLTSERDTMQEEIDRLRQSESGIRKDLIASRIQVRMLRQQLEKWERSESADQTTFDDWIDELGLSLPDSSKIRIAHISRAGH